jgi:hypothetical protein
MHEAGVFGAIRWSHYATATFTRAQGNPKGGV